MSLGLDPQARSFTTTGYATVAAALAAPRQFGRLVSAVDTGRVYFDDGVTLIDLTLTGGGGGSTLANTINQDIIAAPYTVPASTFFDGNVIISAPSGINAAPSYSFNGAGNDGSISESAQAWATLNTKSGTGTYVYDINYGLTEEPALFVNAYGNGGNIVAADILSASNTQFTVQTKRNGVVADVNFAVVMVPNGVDSTFDIGNPIYVAKISAAGSLISENTSWVGGVSLGANITTLTPSAQTVPPFFHATANLNGVSAPANVTVPQFITATQLQWQHNTPAGNGSTKRDTYVMMIPLGADNPGASAYAGGTINNSGTIADDVGGVTVSKSSARFTLNTGGIYTEVPTYLGSARTQFNGGDGSSRLFAGIDQSVGTGTIARYLSSSENDHGFGDAAIMSFGNGSDSFVSGGSGGTSKIEPIKLGAGVVISTDGNNVTKDGDPIIPFNAGNTVFITGGEFS
jgi:hypothetical protein